MTVDLDATLQLGPLHLAIGTLSDEVKDLKHRMQIMQDDLNPTGTVTYSTADTNQNYIDLGGPTAGKWWQVRNLIVGGADITDTPNGIAWILVTASSMMQNNPPLFAVRDYSTARFPTATALPYLNSYGTHELVVLDDQHLFVFLTGGVNATQYCASAMIESFPQFVKGRL
jgi:hypothetical protein